MHDVQQPPPPPQLVPSIDDVPFESIPLFTGDIPFEGDKPKAKSRQDDPKYWLFNAVTDGCKDCVAFCVDRHGIDKDVVSDTNQCTAQVWESRGLGRSKRF